MRFFLKKIIIKCFNVIVNWQLVYISINNTIYNTRQHLQSYLLYATMFGQLKHNSIKSMFCQIRKHQAIYPYLILIILQRDRNTRSINWSASEIVETLVSP